MCVNNIDALDGLFGIDDDSVDLVILDPDYQDWDSLLERGLICESVRVLKPTGNILCFTKEPFDLNLRNEIDHIYRREIVWTFSNGGAWSSPRMPLLSHQKIYWAAPCNEFFFNPRTGLGYSDKTKQSFKRTNKVFGNFNEEGRVFQKSKEGTWIRDHYHYNKPQSGKIPAKPKELMQICVRCFCPNGGIVVDPFSGSGVVADVCMDEGREYIGFEIEKDRCDAVNRMICNVDLFGNRI